MEKYELACHAVFNRNLYDPAYRRVFEIRLGRKISYAEYESFLYRPYEKARQIIIGPIPHGFQERVFDYDQFLADRELLKKMTVKEFYKKYLS